MLFKCGSSSIERQEKLGDFVLLTKAYELKGKSRQKKTKDCELNKKQNNIKAPRFLNRSLKNKYSTNPTAPERRIVFINIVL